MIRIDYPDGSIGLRPETPNEWLWKDHPEDVKRQFVPSVGTTPDCEPYWHECEPRYKEGYELLWSIRQEEHSPAEREALEAQYAAWQEANPDLVEEIEEAVPIKPEPDLAAEIDNAVPVKPEPEGGEV